MHQDNQEVRSAETARKYSVVLVPEFPNGEEIQELCRRYDPRYGSTPYHISLVSLFETSISEADIIGHLREVASGHDPIVVAAQGICGFDGRFLFLNVKEGNDRIIALSDALYTGVIEPFFRRECCYFPHITVGRLSGRGAFEAALVETTDFRTVFRTTVDLLVMKRIEPNGQVSSVCSLPLGRQSGMAIGWGYLGWKDTLATLTGL